MGNPETTDQTAPPVDPGRSWRSRLILGAITVVALGIAWFVGATVIPRWWAQRLGNVVDGRLTFGSLLGFSIGFAFTLLPLFVLWLGWRFRQGWGRLAITVGVALLAAAPNLATLGIVLGNGNAAHAGERILDVDGPGIRGGSLIGAIIGVLVGAGLVFLVTSRRRNKNKARDLKLRLDASER